MCLCIITFWVAPSRASPTNSCPENQGQHCKAAQDNTDGTSSIALRPLAPWTAPEMPALLSITGL